MRGPQKTPGAGYSRPGGEQFEVEMNAWGQARVAGWISDAFGHFHGGEFSRTTDPETSWVDSYTGRGEELEALDQVIAEHVTGQA